MRAINKLSATRVKNASPGKHSDGGRLWLFKRNDGGAQWILRVTVNGERKKMGLGSPLKVSLKDARKEAEKWRRVAQQGRNPIKERQRKKREAQKDDISLAEITRQTFESRRAELRRHGQGGRWMSPLEMHVLPKLGRIPIVEIDQRDIKRVLEPIWHTKADTAKKAMDRLGIVIQYAGAMGLDVDLNAIGKARALLGKSRHAPKPIPAMPWQEVPAFYASLSDGTITQPALRLLILTAGTRSKPVRFCRLDETEGDVWTAPCPICQPEAVIPCE